MDSREPTIKLGALELGRVPRIAVPFDDTAGDGVIEGAKRSGLDVAEIRIDQFRSHAPDPVRAVIARFGSLPTIATIRCEREGGAWRGAEEERLALFRHVVPLVDAVDVELGSREILAPVAEAAKRAGKLLIVSYHDFASTPDAYTLATVCDDALRAGADVVKLATHVRARADIHSLAQFCISNAEKRFIAIGMGAEGLSTRLLLPALGSLVTFAHLGRPTAPGQLPFEEMLGLMRRIYPAFDAEKREKDRCVDAR